MPVLSRKRRQANSMRFLKKQRRYFPAAAATAVPFAANPADTAVSPAEFSEFCHLHGMHDIFNSRTLCLRYFWMSAFFIAMSIAVYECGAIISAYVKSPVVVSYVVKESKALRLPDVVVCPFNRFNSSFLREHNVSDNLTDYIHYSFGLGGHYYKFQYGLSQASIPDHAAELDALLENLGMSYTQFVNNASVRCDALVSHCVFPDHGQHDCCQSAQGVMTSVGKCYRIIGVHQTAAGFGFGMTLFINIPYHLYTPAMNNIHNDGVAIKLVEGGRGLDFDLKFLPSGVHALMPLRATQYDFISDPPRYQCDMRKSANYSRVQCFDGCIFAHAVARCNCTHIAGVSSLSSDLPACKTSEFYSCMINETMEIMNANINYISDCRESCKPNCTYWQYSSEMTYARFPAPTIRRFASEEEMKTYNQSIILDMYFENLEYTMIKHFPSMTVDTFIANLGGQVGLWVGGSILTLLQVLVFCVQLCLSSVWTIGRQKSHRRRRHESEGHVLENVNREERNNCTSLWATCPPQPPESQPFLNTQSPVVTTSTTLPNGHLSEDTSRSSSRLISSFHSSPVKRVSLRRRSVDTDDREIMT